MQMFVFLGVLQVLPYIQYHSKHPLQAIYNTNQCVTFQTTSAAQQETLHHHQALPTQTIYEKTHCTDLTFLPSAVVYILHS